MFPATAVSRTAGILRLAWKSNVVSKPGLHRTLGASYDVVARACSGGMSGKQQCSVSTVPRRASCGGALTSSAHHATLVGRMRVVPDVAGSTGSVHQSVGAVRTLFGQTFDVGTMEAYPRTDTGSRRMKKARKAGLVPGVLYGRREDGNMAEPVLLFLEERDIAREVRKRGNTLENTLYDITINGETIRVLPRQLEMHPYKPLFYRLNFIRYHPGQHPGARIRIPFKTMNEDRCPALKEGGWLLNLQYSLPVFAKGETIPDYLMLDLRGKKVGSKVQVSEVYLNEGVALRTKQGRPKEFPVAKLIGSRRNVSANEPKQS